MPTATSYAQWCHTAHTRPSARQWSSTTSADLLVFDCSTAVVLCLDVCIVLLFVKVAGTRHNWAIMRLHVVVGVRQCKVKSKVLPGLSGCCHGGLVARAAGPQSWAHKVTAQEVRQLQSDVLPSDARMYGCCLCMNGESRVTAPVGVCKAGVSGR
jgi:hypothetical protein